jgi:hypothetical protein
VIFLKERKNRVESSRVVRDAMESVVRSARIEDARRSFAVAVAALAPPETPAAPNRSSTSARARRPLPRPARALTETAPWLSR